MRDEQVLMQCILLFQINKKNSGSGLKKRWEFFKKYSAWVKFSCVEEIIVSSSEPLIFNSVSHFFNVIRSTLRKTRNPKLLVTFGPVCACECASECVCVSECVCGRTVRGEREKEAKKFFSPITPTRFSFEANNESNQMSQCHYCC